MNRTDRLYALVEDLRARAPRTMRAVELAERFSVSTRTIERDLLALQEAGVPIWAQPGPGGGYGLNVDTTLPPLNLTPDEAVALATALAAMPAMPFAPAGQSALRKLTAVMAPARRDEAIRLAQRIRVTPVAATSGDPVATTISQALLDSVPHDLTYLDGTSRQTDRTVEPGGLIGTPRGWYLAAWCRLRLAPRTFRLDRILRLSPTAETITPRPLESLLQDVPLDFSEPALQ